MRARTVKVTDILQEYPTSILVSEMVGSAGKLRPFAQKIQVRDAGLWVRLTAEVVRGDTISIVAQSVWPEERRYYTVLSSFTNGAGL